MHIPPFDNQNKAIINIHDAHVPLIYFNIVKLKKGESFSYQIPGYETCIVPATGCVDVNVDTSEFGKVGNEAVMSGMESRKAFMCQQICLHRWSVQVISCEIFVAGARYEERLTAFCCTKNEIDVVQYGSDDTKTHRKIKHILGQKQAGKVGRLLVSELYTVGAGGWSGFPPHKHDTDCLPDETRHDEVYNFRFKPDHGFGMQLLEPDEDKLGEAFHIVDGSSFAIKSGYHPCVVAPGYEMYYFTILGGFSQRSLVQYFQPEHAWQVETIPGIKDMIAKFK